MTRVLSTKEQQFFDMISAEMAVQGLTEVTEENIKIAKDAIHDRMIALLNNDEVKASVIKEMGTRLWNKFRHEK